MRVVTASALLLALASSTGASQVVGVAVDAKATLVDGELTVLPSPPADYVAFFQFVGTKTIRLGQVPVPTSYLGPPSSVVVAPDASFALVSTSMRVDPADPKKLAPDSRVSVVDLVAPRRVAQTLELSAPPYSLALDRAGTLAVAPHPTVDSLSVLAISGGRAVVTENVSLAKGSGPTGAVFSPDGKRLLVSFPAAGRVGVFDVEAGHVKMPARREMSVGVWPTSIAWCGSSDLAVVANYGKVTGDADTVSLLDLGASPPRVVDTATVGPAPEGVACSPNGRWVVAAVQNMSTVPKSSPFHSPESRVVLLKVDGKRLVRTSEAAIGGWAQGVGFLDDSRTVFAQSALDRSVRFLRVDAESLRVSPIPQIVFSDGAPVAYGISGR